MYAYVIICIVFKDLVSTWKEIPMHQNIPYLTSIYKSSKDLEFIGRRPKTKTRSLMLRWWTFAHLQSRWNVPRSQHQALGLVPSFSLVDILKIKMCLQCTVLWCWCMHHLPWRILFRVKKKKFIKRGKNTQGIHVMIKSETSHDSSQITYLKKIMALLYVRTKWFFISHLRSVAVINIPRSHVSLRTTCNYHRDFKFCLY